MKAVGRDLRTRRFRRTLATHVLAGIGAISAALQLYDIIEPDKIGDLHLPVGLIVFCIASLYGVIRAWPRPIEEQYSKPNTHIRIVEGNLFDQPVDLVIGMCDTFDTAVPHIVASNSVQGQFLARMFSNDQAALDDALVTALAGATVLGSITKDGKQDKYAIGTVAVIRRPDRRQFFCVAYSEMNEQNEARATVGGVWQSLENVWREVRSRSNGAAIAIPVIGGGQARLSQILPGQDSIRLIALSFMLASRQEKVCDRLDIVVRPEDVKKLDMLELRAFLGSLEES